MTEHRPLGGLLIPIITPFDRETGDVAPVPLRAHARHLLGVGVDGIVAAGSTGEAALLDEGEFVQVIAWLRDVVPDDRWLVAGAGRESTRASIAACRAAAQAGADAVLVRPPAYYGSGLDPQALADHFRAIADASPVPVLLYNIPKYTHVMLLDAVVLQVASHPNVHGAKDSSGDLKNFAAWRAAAPDWALFVGSGSHGYAALELGAAGGILAIGNVVPPVAVDLLAAWHAGDRPGAGAAQERLTPLNKLIVGELGVPGVKAAVELVGGVAGPVRAPLRDVGQKDRLRISHALKGAGDVRT